MEIISSDTDNVVQIQNGGSSWTITKVDEPDGEIVFEIKISEAVKIMGLSFKVSGSLESMIVTFSEDDNVVDTAVSKVRKILV